VEGNLKNTTSNKHFAERARRAFTRGFPSSNPADLVESGQRTIGEWLQILAAQRDLDEQINSHQAREHSQFNNDDGALRFKVLGLLSDHIVRTTPELHLALSQSQLSTLRKLLSRLEKSQQVEAVMRVVSGLEITYWTITLRGQRELNAHLARTTQAPLTSASMRRGEA
jgi:DNA-binding PadR family transcriptional regulator